MMDCLTGPSSGSIQDDDVALAELLQEQERALYLLGRATSTNQVASEELSDEEMARRLQEEEDQAAYELAYTESARMANLAPDGAAASDAGADGEHMLEEAEEEEEQEQSAMEFSYETMLALGDMAGKVSKGLKDDALDRLPVVRVCSLRGEAGLVSLDRCCICQMELEPDDEATPLPCRHYYHSDCVRQWLHQSKACPVCGKELEAA